VLARFFSTALVTDLRGPAYQYVSTETAIVLAADSSVLSLPRLPQTPDGPLGSNENKGAGTESSSTSSRGRSVSPGESVGRSTVLLRELETDPPSSSIFYSSLQWIASAITVEGAAGTSNSRIVARQRL
jgi:hypothetical protein